MNDRIIKLAQESFFDEATNATSDKMYTFSEAKMQKFAELIVQDCLDKISGLIVEETFENLEEIDPWLKWNQALGHVALEIELHFWGDHTNERTNTKNLNGHERSSTNE